LASNGGVVNLATSGQMTTIKGTLNVDEAVTLDNILTVENTLRVLTGDVYVNTGTTNLRDLNIKDTLLNNKFKVDSETGNTVVSGTFDVSGDTTVSTFDSTGATSLATGGGIVNIASTGQITTVKGRLNVDETVTLNSILQIGNGLKGGQIYSTPTDHELVIDPFALDNNDITTEDASGNVTILGNLVVRGNTTTIHSINLDISDHLLKIASGSTSAGQTNGAGIEIGDGYATFTYNSAGSGSWKSNIGLDVIGDTSVSTFDSTGATSLATNGGAVNIASSGYMTNIKGNLNVDEAVTLDNNLTVSGILNVDGVSNAHVPSGVIVMWYGSESNIPSGWRICNGYNNTPDLRDRFIIGAGNNYELNDTGGQENVKLTESELPSHRHYIDSDVISNGGHRHQTINQNNRYGHEGARDSNYTSYNDSYRERLICVTDGDNRNMKTTAGSYWDEYIFNQLQTDYHQGHSHEIKTWTDYRGQTQSHENRPPYYALYYIMKL
jgi:microcystin-dependent protein